MKWLLILSLLLWPALNAPARCAERMPQPPAHSCCKSKCCCVVKTCAKDGSQKDLPAPAPVPELNKLGLLPVCLFTALPLSGSARTLGVRTVDAASPSPAKRPQQVLCVWTT